MKRLKALRLFIVLLLAGQINSLLEVVDKSRESILASSIARLVFEVQKKELRTIHFIKHDTNQDDVLSAAVEQIGTSLAYTIEDSAYIYEKYPPRWFNIIFVNGESELTTFLRKITHLNFAPRGFYIIAVQTKLNAKEREDLSRFAFKEFFAKFYDNVVALFGDELGASVLMYTFFPCNPDHPCYEVIPVVYNTFNGSTFTRKVHPFPDKWKNFNGCKISVTVDPNPPYILPIKMKGGKTRIGGIDGKILEVTASHLNFTVDYKLLKGKGVLYPNGTAAGAVGELLNGNASLIAGGYSPTKTRVEWLSVSVDYSETELVYALPVCSEFGSLRRHFLPFSKDTWILYLSVHCIAFILLSLLKAFRSKAYNFIVGDHTRSPLLDMFQMFYGIGFHRTPKYNFARSLFAIWLLSTLIMSSVYRGSLFEILTSRKPKSIPQTIKELDDMKYEIRIQPQMEVYMRSLYGNDRRLKLETEDAVYYFKELQIPSGRYRVVLDSALTIKFFNARHYRNGVLPILKERLMSIPVVILFKNNSYLVTPFNKVLRYYVNNGLIKKWLDDALNNGPVKGGQATSGPKNLGLSHFEGAFQLFGFVIAMSMLTFVLELVSLKLIFLRKIILFYTE